MQLEIEETALKKETDHLSQDRLAALQKELAELRDDLMQKRLSGRTRRALLTRSASFVKRLSPQRMKSRQHSRTMTWKRQQSFSTVCSQTCRRSWNQRRHCLRTEIYACA